MASAVGVTIHRGPIDERVESGEEGIEQTWRFGVRPRGAGDLVVRVRVEGNRFAGKSAHGLAFVDDKTRARMTYGDGTWVDAAGVRTEVPARFVDGAVELRVSSVLVEASAFPAILDPSVGPEFAMDSPVFNPVTSPDLYEDVEVGYGAGTYLVTWFDGSLPQPRQAVRVRASDGVVLDATPIGLLAGKPLAIASDGTNFLLAWSGGAARLAIRDGALLDGPAGFATPTQSPGVGYVSVDRRVRRGMERRDECKSSRHQRGERNHWRAPGRGSHWRWRGSDRRGGVDRCARRVGGSAQRNVRVGHFR